MNQPSSEGPRLTKVTVNLAPKAVDALEQAVEANQENKTDVVNRAIQAYAFMTQKMADGWKIHLQHPDGKEYLIHFL